ncbi:MAG: histidine phosphatase family protein, partial [Bdellovibrionales bacterium]|nr:histidine phosphatase family protein [Bdellovibrionales bacterium]
KRTSLATSVKVKVIFFRHEPAGDRDEFAKSNRDDRDRPLTDPGIVETRKAAIALNRIANIGNSLVLTSPWTRAFQTAEILANECGGRVEICEGLIPPMCHSEFRRYIEGLNVEKLVIVGHNPDLSDFLASLLKTGTDSGISLNKAGAAIVQNKSGVYRMNAFFSRQVLIKSDRK